MAELFVDDREHRIAMTVNGETVEALADTRKLLAHFLREDVKLAGVRIGCDTSSCGACAVLLDGRGVKSCNVFAIQAAGRNVTTIEGISGEGVSGEGIGGSERLHPVQEAFRQEHALQCGYCTSGFVIAALELLENVAQPTEHEVREGLSGNLCRCTGYTNIVKAVQRAGDAMARHEEGRE